MLSFTAVIPTYNRAHLIARAVESVLNQTHPPAELIVVDDGSQDETAVVLQQFGERIRYVAQENGGSAVARHHGFRLAQHEWVALLDSDDVWQPDHLSQMATAIEQTQGQANYYFADTIRPSEKGGGSRWKAVGLTVTDSYRLNRLAADWVLLSPQPMMLQSTVFKKTAYFAAGGFLPPLRYRDDTHLFLKLGLTGPVCAVNHVGAVMQSDDDAENRLTLTYDRAVKGAQMQVIMFEDLLRTMPDLPADVRQELKRRLSYAHLAIARHASRQKALFTAVFQAGRSVRVRPLTLWESVQRNWQKLTPSFR